jgi:IMP dehydrogenase
MTKDNLVVAAAKTILRKPGLKTSVVNKSGKLIGLITYRDICGCSFPLAVKDEFGRLRVRRYWALLRSHGPRSPSSDRC